MTRTKKALIATGVVAAAIVAYGLVTSPRPTQSEKDRAAVEKVADRFTHQEIAEAWAKTKAGNSGPMEWIQKAFPFAPRGVREEGPAIVLTFAGHDQSCIHFRTGPDGDIVFARRC